MGACWISFDQAAALRTAIYSMWWLSKGSNNYCFCIEYWNILQVIPTYFEKILCCVWKDKRSRNILNNILYVQWKQNEENLGNIWFSNGKCFKYPITLAASDSECHSTSQNLIWSRFNRFWLVKGWFSPHHWQTSARCVHQQMQRIEDGGNSLAHDWAQRFDVSGSTL